MKGTDRKNTSGVERGEGGRYSTREGGEERGRKREREKGREGCYHKKMSLEQRRKRWVGEKSKNSLEKTPEIEVVGEL